MKVSKSSFAIGLDELPEDIIEFHLLPHLGAFSLTDLLRVRAIAQWWRAAYLRIPIPEIDRRTKGRGTRLDSRRPLHTAWVHTLAPRLGHLDILYHHDPDDDAEKAPSFDAHTLPGLLARCSHLVSLRLHLCNSAFHMPDIIECCRRVPTLKQLDISLDDPALRRAELIHARINSEWRSEPLTMELAQTLSSYCPSLESLTLHRANLPIRALAHFQNLTELNQIICESFQVADIAHVLRRCPRVTSLKTYKDFTVAEARVLATAAAQLTSISLNLTTNDAAATCALMRACPNLTALDLNDSLVDETVLLAMLRALPSGQLKRLQLSDYDLALPRLTDAVVAQLLEAQPRLECLSMPNTHTFTVNVLPLIAARAPRLIELDCPYCEALLEPATPALLQFVEDCPTLRKLTVSTTEDFDADAVEEGNDAQADALLSAMDEMEEHLVARGGELVIEG